MHCVGALPLAMRSDPLFCCPTACATDKQSPKEHARTCVHLACTLPVVLVRGTPLAEGGSVSGPLCSARRTGVLVGLASGGAAGVLTASKTGNISLLPLEVLREAAQVGGPLG